MFCWPCLRLDASPLTTMPALPFSQRLAPARRHRPAVGAPWGWALTGVLLGLLLSGLVFAPARWLAAAVHDASSQRLRLDDAQGTLWSGSAWLTLTGGAGSLDASTLPSRLIWSLQPGMGVVNVQLSSHCCLAQPLSARLEPRWGGAQLLIADGRSSWPAPLLSGLGTPFNTIAPEGQLALSTRGLSLSWVEGRLQLAGVAELDLQELASRLSSLRPAGSYRLSLVGGTTPQLSLSTLQGSLQLSGSGQWVGGRLRFEGVASSAPEHQAALSNLLNIIGRRDGARSFIKLG